jgi:hypothetical protein
MAVALVLQRASVFPAGVAGVGAAYGIYAGLRGAGVDPWAPLVAVALFVAAETGYWSLERSTARGTRTTSVRRLAWLVAGAIVTALVASLVLVAASGASGGISLEAAGVAAAVAVAAAIAWLAARPST